ncbi:hypothetical protein CRM22_010656 [Opisthorchis felineus]|uniref:Zinc finger CCHC-type and RNA-binding motif-containing protein 1 n=1 Tax=Opisthorchis felineus TaxID=147828 RepID=A0A4S2KQX5_OPIFE|nr:hypothetical protein CRM22_010656 [Opisthorchis felineus]
MSGGLAPSKSTVYISNLPFSLTNNDLHQILSPYGRVVRVTIVKDRESRKSKGIAFALFLGRNDARQCASQLNNTKLFGRTLKASIAKDNGRAAEFIRRREYPNKSRCYECGEFGHLSYKCSKNALGERVPPTKKRKDRKKSDSKHPRGSGLGAEPYQGTNSADDDVDEEEEGEEPGLDSWSAAVNYQTNLLSQSSSTSSVLEPNRRRRIRQDTYFSDEEELDEDV